MVGWFQGDTDSPTYEGEAVYDKGEIRFTFNASDGSSFEFRGDVRDDGMQGEFGISAWRIIKNAGSGIWQAKRTLPSAATIHLAATRDPAGGVSCPFQSGANCGPIENGLP